MARCNVLKTLFFIPLLLWLCWQGKLYAQAEVPSGKYQAPRDSGQIVAAITRAERLAVTAPDSALQLLQQIIVSSKEKGFDYGVGLSLLQQGIIQTNQNQLPAARSSFDEALTRLQKQPWSRRKLYRVYSNMGNVAFLEGHYEQALQLQFKAIATGEQYPDSTVDLSYLYGNVAAILAHTGRGAADIKRYLATPVATAIKKKDTQALGKLYNNIAVAFSVEKQWDSSFVYFRKALLLATAANLKPELHLALCNMGITHLEQQQNDSALFYLERAVAMDTVATAAARERTRAALGICYLNLNQPSKASPLLMDQYELAKQRNNKQELRTAYYNLSRLYGAEGRYREAWDYAWQYISANDSIAGAEVIGNVNMLETRFRTAEKEKQLLEHKVKLAGQQKAIQNRDKWLWISVTAIVFLIILSALLGQNYRNRKKLLAEKLQRLNSEQTINMLQATIEGEEQERSRIAKELHDGVGALLSATRMNLASLARQGRDPASADLYQSTLSLVEEMSSELRLTAHNMMPVSIRGKDLADAVLHFCHALSREGKTEIEVITFGDLSSLSSNIQLHIYRIIQELVNNTVKHAAANSALVQLVLQEGILSITVEDNGKGFPYSKEGHYDGVGLRSVKNRVDSMNGHLSVNSKTGKGTSVYIEFEFNHNDR